MVSSVHVYFLFFLIQVQAITFDHLLNTVAQCEPLLIKWSLSQEEKAQAPSPFNITFLPFDSQPFNLTVTPSNSEDAGIFAQALPIISGTSFLIAAGEGANAITSSIITVTPSSNSSCVPQQPRPPPFFVKSRPVNCIPKLFNMSCAAVNCSDTPIVQGFVPTGKASFPVAPIGTPASWFISVQQETQILLEFTNQDGQRLGTSDLLTVGGPDAIDDCETLLFFLSNNGTSQQKLPAKRSSSPTLTSRAIIGIVIGGTVGLIALLWFLFLIRQYFKRKRGQLNRGVEAGTGGSRTMTDRDFVLDSEFGMTFSSVIPSSRGTMTSKAYEKSPQNQLFRYSRSMVPLPTNDRMNNAAGASGFGETRAQPPLMAPSSSSSNFLKPSISLKPAPIRVPSYVPMDVVAESRRSEDASVYQGKLSPSLLPEWAQRSPSRHSTATTIKRQTRESGRVV